MPWRNSPFFERQLAAITRDDESAQAFVAEILDSSTDEPLLVFADWLEERGDARAEYVRDMCALAAGQRSLDPIVDRVNAFEDTLETRAQVYCRAVDACWLFSLTDDKLLASEDIEAIRQQLSKFLDEAVGVKLAVVDLRRVRFMGSAFLGTLITLHRSMHQQGGELCLCRVNSSLLELLQITRLDKLFSIHDTVDAAVP